MKAKLTRREFLKYGLFGLGALAFLPNHTASAGAKAPRYMLVGNKDGTSIHKLPDESSVIMYQRAYNDIINVYDEVVSEAGPIWNPVWFRVWGGYAFSGDLYEVKYKLNPLQTEIRETGQLAEVTVPYTRSMFYSRYEGWKPEYLLYYRSTHWVMDVLTGPDDKPWYKIKDEKNSVELAVPSEHLRFVPDEELAPIHPDVLLGKKRIEVSLPLQRLQAYEGDELIFETKISSGFPTPEGTYNIQTKMASKHMGLGNVTSNVYAHELVGVPWNCFFQMKDGMATHGTFWHTNFGTPMSGGCLNMSMDDAKWIYLWTTPIPAPEDWAKHGYGTPIHISK
ncbi:MAG: L,D-transpeptidase [Anaerolineaceae bacterium]